MLILDITNDNPSTEQDGLSVKYTAPSVSASTAKEPPAFCFCNVQCDYEEFAFHEETGDEYKNDTSHFLFAKKKASDTVVFKLLKNDELIAEITDDTYGTLTEGYPSKPLYYGLVVEWRKVYEEHGNGRFSINAELDILGTEILFESHYYKVTQFSEELANGTVVVETFQSGNILGSDFDFTELVSGGYKTRVRIFGLFGKKKPVFEKDEYVSTGYISEQIQAKISAEYILEAKMLPSGISNDLFYSNITADRILISDFNILNHEQYRSVDVVPEGNESVDYFSRNNYAKHIWKFSDRVKNKIKTNY